MVLRTVSHAESGFLMWLSLALNVFFFNVLIFSVEGLWPFGGVIQRSPLRHKGFDPWVVSSEPPTLVRPSCHFYFPEAH